MHFWNIQALAQELGQNQVSEKTGMYYFLASALLILFTTYYSLWWGVVRDWLFYFELLVLAVITIFGCLKAFESNGASDGRAFVQRAVCLSVPAGVRVNVLSLIFGLSLYFTADQIFSVTSFADPVRAYTIVSYAGFVGFNIYFWWLLIRGFDNVKHYE